MSTKSTNDHVDQGNSNQRCINWPMIGKAKPKLVGLILHPVTRFGKQNGDKGGDECVHAFYP